jgi:hypothetical protein
MELSTVTLSIMTLVITNLIGYDDIILNGTQNNETQYNNNTLYGDTWDN